MSESTKAHTGPAIFWAGLVSGILDIGYVFIVYGFKGASPMRILQSIAATLLGKADAAKGGWGSASLGLAMHFAIAFSAAAVYWLLSRRLPVLIRWAVASGVLYGIGVWLVMNLAVLPLVNGTRISFPPAQWKLILPPHVFCIGLPIALIVRRFSL